MSRFLRRLRTAWTAGPPSEPSIPAACSGAFCSRLLDDAALAVEAERRWKEHADSYAAEAAEARTSRDEALRQQATLVAWLAALHPSTAVIAPDTHPAADGGHVLYIVAGGWQMRWPIAAQDTDLFRGVTPVDATDPRAQWDGHGPAQRDLRIRCHTRLLANSAQADTAIADGPVTAADTPSEVVRRA